MRRRIFGLLVFFAGLPLAACSTANGGSSVFTGPLAVNAGTLNTGEAASLISRYRAGRGLAPVTVDPTLTRIATVHARRMAAANKMAHVLPGEGSFMQRLAAGGFQPATAGENVAAGQKTLAAVLEAWRKSPGHNANLLLAGATKIGIAVAVAPDSRYKTFWSLVIGEARAPAMGLAAPGGPNAGPFLPTATGATLEIN